MSIIITDPELIEFLQEQAKTQNIPAEYIIKNALLHPISKEDEQNEEAELIRQTMHKIYNMARDYWQSVGNMERANMTDDELAEKFGAFDENGVPRFIDELSAEPPVGSGAYVAKVIAEIGEVVIDEPLNDPIEFDTLKETMAKEFGDHLYKRMNGE